MQVLNCGDAMFVWLGGGCSFQERQIATQVARGLFARDGHPSWMKLTRVIEGAVCEHWLCAVCAVSAVCCVL